jgi:hypothetical protein
MCLKVARQLPGLNRNHSFSVVQFPFNLFERGALINLNQQSGKSALLDFAKASELGVLINRPLNAMLNNSLIRLADFEVKEKVEDLDEEKIITGLNLLETMEDEFLNEDLPKLALEEKVSEAVNAFLKAGKMFKEYWKNFKGIENFNDVQKQFLIPRLNYAFSVIVKSEGVTDEMKTKLDRIAQQINKLLRMIGSVYGLKANQRSKRIHEKLDELISDKEFKKLSLSQKCLLLIDSLNGVSCTLVGMRQNKYVDDVISGLQCNKINGAEKILKEFQADL